MILNISRLAPSIAALALLAFSGACEPTIDDTQWSCAGDRDCLDGFVCHARIGACVLPENIAARIALTGDPTDPRTAQSRDGVYAALAALGADDLPVPLAVDELNTNAANVAGNAATLVADEETIAVVGHVGDAGLNVLLDTLQSVPLVLFATSTSGATPEPVPVTGKYVMDTGRPRMLQDALTFAAVDGERGAPAANTIYVYDGAAPDDDVLEAFELQNPGTALPTFRITGDIIAAAQAFLIDISEMSLQTTADGLRPVLAIMDAEATTQSPFIPAVRASLRAIASDGDLPSGIVLTDEERAQIRKVSDMRAWSLDDAALVELTATLPSQECAAVWSIASFARQDVFETALYDGYVQAFENIDHDSAAPTLIGLQAYMQTRLLVRAMQNADDPRLRADVLESLGNLDAALAVGWYESVDLDNGYFVDSPRASKLTSLCTVSSLDLSTPTTIEPMCSDGVCLFTGVILEDTTWESDTLYKIRGPVHVGDGQATPTLTIEPGTQILADTTIPTRLVVHRGARLVSNGTASDPVQFTSDKLADQRDRGDWDGIVIVSDGVLNGCGAQTCRENFDGAVAGGPATLDDSGSLVYTRIEFAGEDGHPALHYVAAGPDTVLDHVQIHRPLGPGVQFTGGEVNGRYVYVSGYGEDGVRATRGHQGQFQYLLTHQHRFAGGPGLVAHNNEVDPDALPRTQVEVSHATHIGDPLSPNVDFGVLLSSGGSAQLSNLIVSGFVGACYDLVDVATFNAMGFVDNGMLTLLGETSITDSILSCTPTVINDPSDPFGLSSVVLDPQWNNVAEDPQLENPFVPASPNFLPQADAPALMGANPPSDAFFDNVLFRGAMGTEDWLDGWATDAP